MYCQALILIAFVDLVVSRDFTIGMFRDTDILVTQDIVYKERSPFRETTLKYGKTFACSVSIIKFSSGNENQHTLRSLRTATDQVISA